jgi:hypothetical protein
MPTHDLGKTWHETQLGTVDAEIARQAFICDIRILDPGVIERVVAGDASVCGRRAEEAFRSLRGLVAMHYSLTNDSITALGPEESRKILDGIRERLGKRFDLGKAPLQG